MPVPSVARGEVWLVRLDKVRPAVVLTRDPLGHILTDVHIVPATTTVRGLPTEVRVGQADGLRHESVLNSQTLQHVPRSDFVHRIGALNDERMRQVCRAIAASIGCD